MANSKSKYIRGTYEQLEKIDQDMKLVVNQSLNEYIWERVIKVWVEQSPNLSDELLELPPYVEQNEGLYRIRKNVEGKRYSFGLYRFKRSVIEVLNYLNFKEFPKELSSTYTKKRGEEYREWLKQVIADDAEYQGDGT